ncbi:MAG: hypothetical protein IK100_05155 [Muribaculaceae bacterium]|nr:hypothetical protein [Muribaculaceae bacterium]
MKKIALVSFLIIVSGISAMAQNRLVTEVKKEISGMTHTVDNYKSSLKKINKALENDETKDKAETWWIAGKIQYSIYDKMMANKGVGDKINYTEAGMALIDGYDKLQIALHKDTIITIDKKGKPVIDKKNGKAKFKTKYSQEILNKVVSHLIDYSAVAGDFYAAGDWSNAYKAWDIYCNTAKCEWAKKKKVNEPDSIIGYNRFFQGLAAYQNKDYDKAVEQLANARNLGYRKKVLYDTWIDALIKQQDTIYLVSVAHEAHDMLGAKDPRYVRILINHYLKAKNYDEANTLLDEVIKSDSTVAEYYDLKGRLAETQVGIDAALPFYRKAVELKPDFGMALFDLGNALYSKAIMNNDHRSNEALRLYDEALPYLEKAHQLMPHNENAKKILSRIYYVTGSKKIDEL